MRLLTQLGSIRSIVTADIGPLQQVTVEIESGTVRGEFPRAMRLVLEWAHLDKPELLDDRERARRRQPLQRIPTLE